MDQMAVLGMIFTLIVIAMVGGFILLSPITRRLGALLEQRSEGRPLDEKSIADLRRLESTVRALQQEVEQLSERQVFTESLLSERQQVQLPKSIVTP